MTCMTHVDAVHSKDVSLARVIACDSVGVIITQSAYIKSDISSQFNRSVSHSVACNKLIRLLKPSHI